MTNEQLINIGKIVATTAIETMSNANNCSIDDVYLAIQSGVENAVKQYNTLFTTGMQIALEAK